MRVTSADILLRSETSADQTFLRAVFDSTREEELRFVEWPSEVREIFLASQFKAQTHGYRATFPKGEFQIILWNAEQVGRIVVDRNDSRICLVDIALLTPYRGCGIGTLMLERLCTEARATKRPIHLQVIRGNKAAHLYARLGFVKTGENAIRDIMEWCG